MFVCVEIVEYVSVCLYDSSSVAFTAEMGKRGRGWGHSLAEGVRRALWRDVRSVVVFLLCFLPNLTVASVGEQLAGDTRY